MKKLQELRAKWAPNTTDTMIPIKLKYLQNNLFEKPDDNNDDVKGNIESAIFISDNTTILGELNVSKVKDDSS